MNIPALCDPAVWHKGGKTMGIETSKGVSRGASRREGDTEYWVAMMVKLRIQLLTDKQLPFKYGTGTRPV